MPEQFRTLLHTRPFDAAELNADDQQALLDLFQAARESQNAGLFAGGVRPCDLPATGTEG